jgi:hypothetical protein
MVIREADNRDGPTASTPGKGGALLHRPAYLTVSTEHSARLLTFHETLPINNPRI